MTSRASIVQPSMRRVKFRSIATNTGMTEL